MERAVKTPQGWKDAEASWFKTNKGWLLVDGEPQNDRPIHAQPSKIEQLVINWAPTSNYVRCVLDTYVWQYDGCRIHSYVFIDGSTELYHLEDGGVTTPNPLVLNGLDLQWTDIRDGYFLQQNNAPCDTSTHSSCVNPSGGYAWQANNAKGEMVVAGTLRQAPAGSPNQFMIEEYGISDGESKHEYWLYDWDLAPLKTRGEFSKFNERDKKR